MAKIHLLSFWLLLQNLIYTCHSVILDDTYIDFSTFIITQHALDDAPIRYASYINDAVDAINEESWPQKKSWPSCGAKKIIYGDSATKEITLLEDSLSITITDVGIELLASFYVTAQVKVYYKYCDKILFWCTCDTICNNDIVYVNGAIHTSSSVNVSWDSNTDGGLTLIPKVDVDTSGLDFNINNCNDGSMFYDFVTWLFVDVDEEIQDSVQKETDAYIDEIMQKINLPQTFSPYNGVNITYVVTNLSLVASQYIKFETKAQLTVINQNNETVYYTNDKYSSGDLMPPNVWPQSPIAKFVTQDTIQQETNGTVDTSNNNNSTETVVLYFLNGLRVTADVLVALMWAAQEMGELNPSNLFEVLDATLFFNMSLANPVFRIENNDTLSLFIDFANINGSCYETDEVTATESTDENGGDSDTTATATADSSNDNECDGENEYSATVQSQIICKKRIMEISVQNLTGDCSIELIVDDYDESVYLTVYINSFDMSNISPQLYYPPIPLPETVIEQVMTAVINASIPYLNDWLDTNTLQIPDDIAQFLPNPELKLVYQPEGVGYAQLFSWCTCSNDSYLYVPCGFECEEATVSPSAIIIETNNTSNSVFQTTDVTIEDYSEIYSLPENLDGLYIYLTYVSSINDTKNGICDILDVGDYAYILRVDDTGGACTNDFPLKLGTRTYYHAEFNKSTLGFFCDDGCANCQYETTHVQLGECEVVGQEYNVMILGYESQGANETSNEISNDYIVGEPCIGGNYNFLVNSDDIIWIAYNNSNDCDSSYIGYIRSSCL